MSAAPVDAEAPYPRYQVKLSSLTIDIGKTFIWYVWKQGTEGQLWRSLGAYRSEAEGQMAADADRDKDTRVI